VIRRVLRGLAEVALTILEMWAKMIQHGFSTFPRPRFFGLGFNRGPVAQLGARFHGMEEVVGSIPTRSTKFSQ
jgi:hypothetical protein